MNKLKVFKNVFLEEFSKIQSLEGPSYLYDPIKYFIKSPGKRLRPIIVLFLGELFQNNKEDSINGALGVELLHNFTLVHDDIMDDAPMRRGKQTVHEKWSVNTGILSGDAMLVKAYQSLEAYPDELFAKLLLKSNLFKTTKLVHIYEIIILKKLKLLNN